MPVIACSSAYCFHVTPDFKTMYSGSGDQLIRWVEMATYIVVSLPIAILWTILDKKRKHYRTLFAVLRLWSMLFVASSMIGYGASKIIPSQFPPLTNARLVERIGDMSPMGMLWAFMSTSKPFTIFGGLVEFVTGTLMVIPSTCVFGAFLSCAVSLQVVALNMCYDVPVKLLSVHLLILSLLILSPELPNLIGFLCLQHPAKRIQIIKPFKRGLLNICLWLSFWVFIIYTAVFSIMQSQSSLKYYESAGNSKVAGIWDVTYAQCDDSAQERYVRAWKYLTGDNAIVITFKDGQQSYLNWEFSKDGDSVDITADKSSHWKAHFDLSSIDESHLALTGTMGGANAKIFLEREKRLKRLNRGKFHWATEYPYNR